LLKVTHPFHPLFGQEYVQLDRRLTWGADRVYFEDAGRLRRLPASWTSAADPDPFVELSAGRAFFRVEDLLRLTELVQRLDEAQEVSRK
jgi:hypothetical protein